MHTAQESAALIVSLCDRKGLSVNGMLADCNLKKSVVGNMKLNSMPSADKLANIASYLEVSTDYLLGVTDDPAPPGKKNTPSGGRLGVVDSDDAAFLAKFRALEADDKGTVMELMDFLASKSKKSTQVSRKGIVG